MSNDFPTFTTIFVILFFPFGAVFVRRGFWSFDFAVNAILWGLGTVFSWYLEAANSDYYAFRFCASYLVCSVHTMSL
jgi:uncharacterized membrane protein YqaE (UPF0057 family)